MVTRHDSDSRLYAALVSQIERIVFPRCFRVSPDQDIPSRAPREVRIKARSRLEILKSYFDRQCPPRILPVIG
jgi:hypothetical protein